MEESLDLIIADATELRDKLAGAPEGTATELASIQANLSAMLSEASEGWPEIE